MRFATIISAALLAGAATVAGAQETNAPPQQDPAAQAPVPGAPASAPAPNTPADPSANAAVAQPPAASDPNAQVPPAPIPADASGMKPADAADRSTAKVVGGNETPPPAPLEKYPMCSKTVTDHCQQGHEAKAMKGTKAKARHKK